MPNGTPHTAERFPLVWREYLTVIAIGLVAILALFAETAASAVALWRSSSAYNYGYLIAPIALYMAWLDRGRLSGIEPKPSWWGLPVAAASGLLWLASDLVGVSEGRHFALVGFMQALFLGVLGPRVFRVMLFPLLYLFLMVPTGEFLLSPLQKLSHAGSVALVKLSQIPVFVEGFFIQVPQGNFLVEPGCAGLNFLLASLALALLYGKLTYAKISARIWCVVVALSASMIANIVRIYLIIVITEWSHRRIAIADDHLLYGWGFFGVIMLAMMWLGGRIGVPAPHPKPFVAGDTAWRAPRSLRASGTAAAVLVVAALPVALARATTGVEDAAPMVLMLPESLGNWARTTPPSPWQPGLVPGDATVTATYVAEGRELNIAVVGYRAQRDGREAAARMNAPADGKSWEEVARATTSVTINGDAVTVPQALMRSGNRSRLAITWYVSATCVTASRLTAKLCAAKLRLGGQAAPGAFFALSTDITDTPDSAAQLLQIAAGRIDPFAVLATSKPSENH